MVLSVNQSDKDFYQDKLILLEKTRDELVLRLDESLKNYTSRGLIDLVEHVKIRIKSAKSMKDKLLRRGLPLTINAALNQVYDAVGMRVVCTFIDDVYQYNIT